MGVILSMFVQYMSNLTVWVLGLEESTSRKPSLPRISTPPFTNSSAPITSTPANLLKPLERLPSYMNLIREEDTTLSPIPKDNSVGMEKILSFPSASGSGVVTPNDSSDAPMEIQFRRPLSNKLNVNTFLPRSQKRLRV